MFLERLQLAMAGDALWPRVVLGWRLAWRLRHLRRIGRLRATASRCRRLLLFVTGRLQGRRDLALQTGGAIIAVVGPKGTGKSTVGGQLAGRLRSEEHTSELQSLMRISYAVFCLKKKNTNNKQNNSEIT